MSYTTHNSVIPRFYHLIKTHKESISVKIRPIVANCQGPTTKLAWLLQRILCPLIDTISTHLRSSAQLMEDISKLDRQQRTDHSYPFSLDVNALYTSIPANDAIEAVCNHINEHKDVSIPLRTDFIKDLLEVVLKNTYFTFEDHIYQQIHGLPMGSSVSGTLATIFMYRLELIAIRTMPMALYRRYADDICILTTNREEAVRIMEFMEQQHPDIHFDIEHPTNDRTLCLLDFEFTITSDGGVRFNFYKKAAKKPLFMHHKSALPDLMKRNVIKNESVRIQSRCTERADASSNLHAFRDILRENGYPDKSIRILTNDGNRRGRRRPRKQLTEPVFLELPFVSDGVDGKIRRIIQKYNLPVRIYHRSRTLRQMLRPKQSEPNCHLKNCPLQETDKCNIRKCVYEVTCNGCRASYIGSTIRPLHLRVREHLQCSNSSVFKHKVTCGATFTTSVLGRERDLTSLRIREAIEIRNRQPSVNSRQESEELSDLMF